MASRRFQARAVGGGIRAGLVTSLPSANGPRRRFAGVARADGIVSGKAESGSQPESDSRWRFACVSRGDGIIAAGSAGGSQSESGARRRFTGVTRGDGIVAASAAGGSQRGFSLIEIILVVVLIGGIVAFAATRILGGGDRAKVRLAEAQVQTLAEKIGQFEMDTGTLPASLEQLVTQPGGAVGWLGPYARDSELKDPWNTPYEYRAPGDGKPFDIVSYGADRKPGGESVDADIRNQ